MIFVILRLLWFLRLSRLLRWRFILCRGLLLVLGLLLASLLRRLEIRIGPAGTLGVSRRGRIIGGLSAVGGLVPTLLRLLCALLPWNLLRTR
ncbi:hypothetical protein A3N95_08075 [Mycobacteroides abscessus]|nr:hypothetical protein A3N95_08075 [Mycobacteroides abscessus]